MSGSRCSISREKKCAGILLDESDEGQRLRQTDPFCGILTPAERWHVYREFDGERASRPQSAAVSAGD